MPATLDLPRLFDMVTSLLRLRPSAGGQEPAVEASVQPTLDVAWLLGAITSFSLASDFTGATLIKVYTCPVRRRAYVKALHIAATTGSNMIAVTSQGNQCRLSPSNTTARSLFPVDIWLEAGDTIDMGGGANAGDGSILTQGIVMEWVSSY